MNQNQQRGSLLIIGGSEDRTDSKDILQRFVALAGGNERQFVVLTAASKVPEKVWPMYRWAFDALGVAHVSHVSTDSPEQANNAELAAQVAQAQGILMTGGDQKRLLEILGGSAIEAAMHTAHGGGACIAGTSAGASAIGAHMIAQGKAELAPEKSAAVLGKGMGFISGVVIDQHFSQRHRINRLLSLISEHPFLLGAGIDEDTALVVQPRVGIEVIGEGCVNVVDCRRAVTNVRGLPEGATPEMLGIQLHVLPSGTAFHLDQHDHGRSMLDAGARLAPRQIHDFVTTLVNRNNHS